MQLSLANVDEPLPKWKSSMSLRLKMINFLGQGEGGGVVGMCASEFLLYNFYISFPYL